MDNLNVTYEPTYKNEIRVHVPNAAYKKFKINSDGGKLKIWVFLDPSHNGYFTDMDGNVLSPLEICNNLASRKEMLLNPQSSQEYTNYANYLAKDMYYFYSIKTTGFGVFDKRNDTNPNIYLCPTDFGLNKWKIANLHSRNASGYRDWIQEEIYKMGLELSKQ